jgi:hypothetical protein
MTDVGSSQDAGTVTGELRALLRIEGLMLFAAATVFYWISGASWWLFAGLLLAPDLSFLAYLAGPRLGAIGYNAAHTTIGPILLVSLGTITLWPPAASIALIWLAHIGIDRAVGYGLKYASGFSLTHLGRIGRPTPSM